MITQQLEFVQNIFFHVFSFIKSSYIPSLLCIEHSDERKHSVSFFTSKTNMDDSLISLGKFSLCVHSLLDSLFP